MFAIETEHLTKTYRRQHLGRVSQTRGVEELSFSVNKGEIFGLLGLNGSGKTTTIKLLLGLLRPTGGRVAVLGQAAGSSASLKKTGYLPEVPYFYRYLTASEILAFYARLSDLDRVPERVAG
ncbi:MAG: ATP-binding cassette domain-containing protein, partial [Endomicrobiales bacterium]